MDATMDASDADLIWLHQEEAEIVLPNLSELFGSPSPHLNHASQPLPHQFIDLTHDTPIQHTSSSQPTRIPDRDEERDEESDQRAPKRRRIMSENHEDPADAGPSQEFLNIDDFVTIPDMSSPEESDIEELDLTQVEDRADLEEAHEAQKREKQLRDKVRKDALDALNVQASKTSDVPTLASLSCIICMDNVTNLTATHCGHLFCHECLINALLAGENAETHKGSKCPVCRKGVSRTSTKSSSKALPQVIPLEIKVRKRSEVSKGKQRAVPSQ